MKLSYENKRYLYAAALSILLAGLLFSNGEGIRLLPFPTAAQTSCGNEKLASSVDAGYHENVTRFEKRQTPFALKVKADNGDNAAATGGVMFAVVTNSALALLRSSAFVTESFSARTYSSDRNSRPPPAS